ncbi:sugar phosphate isomerase [Dictyobacter alpinus]|uniref:Sugar phosphate isomerase n=1 Tax=Dictyobacter alpinus TaxID=2014873 RepID=A0A402BE55_9CHLR|nr:sugar phosphate isomerase/epimerase [Dictyobacter alpinus]GCE29664.1 sugar phosphate isomerase [Dictyobacter alpinus]
MSHNWDIRIGTLVDGKGSNPAEFIRQILPYGFESFSLTFWETLGEVDLRQLAASVQEVLADTDVTISALSIFGNPLEETEVDRETLRGWEALIDHAHLFGADIVSGFTGRVRGQSIDASIPRFTHIFEPLTRRAADNGIRLAFENCSMEGTWQTGDWNIAHGPDAWELLFHALPAENLGLEWEPCHQLVNLIDPLPQLRDWVKKIFHVHGKDCTIRWDTIKKYGIHGSQSYANHRTPGFGESNWTDIISELRRGGFTGAIDIEGAHDPVYTGELEMTGQVHGLQYLKTCRGGEYIPNPNV